MRINTDKDCNIIIYDDTEYPVKNLTYLDSVSIYIVQLNLSNTTTVLYNRINPHTNNTGEPIKISPVEGGFITVCKILLPKEVNVSASIMLDNEYVRTRNYIPDNYINSLFNGQSIPQEEEEQEENINTNEGYFSDGINIYKRDSTGIVKQIDLLELLEVNPNAFNFDISLQNFFSVCLLRKCYIALCLKIFNDRAFDRCFNSKVDSLLIYKRDLVWSALNVIQYMIDLNQLAEAQRLLERISGCNGLCAGVNIGEDCGCN